MERRFGELGLGSGRGGSSRRGKKSNSDKPKQPQRGLGVAQLEKIRLQSQMAAYLPSLHDSPFHSNPNQEENLGGKMMFSPPFYSSSTSTSSYLHHGLHANQMVEYGEIGRSDMRYGEFPRSSTASGFFLPHNQVQETVTLPLLEETMEESIERRQRQNQLHSTELIWQNSDLSDTQDLDLDLKL